MIRISRCFRFAQQLWLASLLLAPALSQAGPLHIEADQMLLQHAQSRVEFTGHVRLSQDDFSLNCQRLIAYYAEGRQKLEKAEAFGEVRMQQGKAHGRADTAVLDQQQQTLTLIGHAFIEQDGNRIEGNRIVHRMGRQQTVVLPAEGGRTRMLLETDDGPDAAGAKP